MGTLGGFPYPPAMVRGEQSSPAPHAIKMGTLGGVPIPSRALAPAGKARLRPRDQTFALEICPDLK